MQPSQSDICNALYVIDSHDRDIWVRMAMAVKSELGDAGFKLWDDWSRSANNYEEKSARSVWKSVKPGCGVGIKSLFHEARLRGWHPENRSEYAKPQKTILICHDDKKRIWQADVAAKRAQKMLSEAREDTHPYLGIKGFPDERGFVLGSDLLIPMFDAITHSLLGLQRIYPGGDKWIKKMLPGMRASGAIYQIGRGAETWLVEGYATGLSVRLALDTMCVSSNVLVCFSAGNLTKIALILCHHRRLLAFADNDASGAGQAAVEKAGIPYAIAPRCNGEKSVDANDLHFKNGIFHVCNVIKEARKRY